jgi:hypothetical protein
MIDPVAAAAGCAKAYAMVKGMVEAGRSVEDTMSQIGVWWGHYSDAMECDKKEPSPFRKVVFAKSVQAEALERFARQQKLRAQRREVVQLIRYSYGDVGLEEFRQLQKTILRERELTIYNQRRMKEKILAGFTVIIGSIPVAFLIWVIFQKGGK